MNVCGENPIMAALHQAYRKHNSEEAKAFEGQNRWGGIMQIRPRHQQSSAQMSQMSCQTAKAAPSK